MELFAFGGHEGKLETVIHPLAADVHHPAQNPAVAWRTSRLRAALEDGAWLRTRRNNNE